MNLRRCCLFVLIAGVASVAAPLHSADAEKPNLIIILADDLGWSDLGCYGNTFNETPNIDRLAREGLRFTQFYAGPVCSPTRANLQSGEDQARFGITQHIPGHKRPFARLKDPEVPLQMPLSVETFAERIGATGYRTGYFGKWHLGKQGFGPADQGWQTALECQGHVQPPKVTGAAEPVRNAAFLTDKAVAFIQAHRGEPFLLQVSHFAVHIPLSTTPELLAKYQQKKAMPGYPSNPTYAGLLEELDQSVGRIVAAVDEAGLGDRTLIWFLSDNGGLVHEQDGTVVTSNAPLNGEKGTLYEGGIRIPAITRWTGTIPAGKVCKAPVITMDIYPTLAELGGASLPKDQPADGVSIAKLLVRPNEPPDRGALYWHLPHYHHSTPASAMRQGDWKLIEFFEDEHLELYNLNDDIGETKNLAGSETQRAASMLEDLRAWRKRVDARMPVPNPNYDPARATELAKGKGRSE